VARQRLSLSPTCRDLLITPVTAVFATVGVDGGPHAVPVWFWLDGDSVLVSTRTGTQKHLNAVRNRRVSLTVTDPENTMHYVEIRGNAVVADDPDCEVRDRVVRKHGFADGSAFDPPDVQRVSIRIEPTRIIER
jgi:PPOX class probable F420-dependent enzyme